MGTSKDERRDDELFKGARMKAFPNHRSEGMELRDYFAASVLQGMCANTNDDHDGIAETYDWYCADVARCCYALADAMMKAREQK